MDKLRAKQLNNIVKAINIFQKTNAELKSREILVGSLEKERGKMALSKSEFATRIGLTKQEYEQVLKLQYKQEYIAKLLDKLSK